MISVLSPFPLKIGRIEATFAESEKAFLLRSLLIMLVKWESIIFADILTIFGGILSGPVAFLEFIFQSTCVESTCVDLRVLDQQLDLM